MCYATPFTAVCCNEQHCIRCIASFTRLTEAVLGERVTTERAPCSPIHRGIGRENFPELETMTYGEQKKGRQKVGW